MPKKAFLERICNVLILLVPFIPFVVSNSLFFPFITGKAFAFRTIITLLFSAWIFLAILDKKFRPKKSAVLYSVLVFIFVVGLATFFSVNVIKSFWSNFERMEGYVTILFIGAYFLALGHVLIHEWQWKRLFFTTIIASFIMSLYGIFQLLGFFEIHQGGVRLDGTFGNATYLAVYSLIHIFIIMFWMARYAKTKSLLYFTSIALILQISILYFTATRGAILGFIGGIILAAITFLIAGKKDQYVRIRKISGIGLILISCFLVLFLLIKNTDFIKNDPVLGRFSNISVQDNTTVSRFLIWDIAIQGFKERPLLGYGQENFIYIFSEKYNPALYAQEAWFDRAHNIFLDWMISAGIFGILSYLALFIFGLYSIYRTDKLSILEKSILFGLLSAYGFHNMFVFDHLYSYVLFFTLLGYIHFMTSEEVAFIEDFNASRNIRYAAGIVIVFVLVFILNKTVIIPRDAGKELIKGLSYPISAYNLKMEHFQKALSKTSYLDMEIRQHMTNSIYAITRSTEVPEASKKSIIQFGAEQFIEQTVFDKRDPRNFDITGNYFLSFGDSKSAVRYLEKARDISPKKDIILINLSRAYFENGEKEKSLELAKYVYELDKRSSRNWNFYLLLAGAAEEKELFNEILNDAILNGHENFVIDKFKNDIQNSPDDIERYLSLVTIYLNLGHYFEARDTLKEIDRLFTDKPERFDILEKQVSTYLNSNPQ